MIAWQGTQPEPPPRRREPGAQRTRDATRRRIVRAQRRGYLAFGRVCALAAAVMLPLMLYVMLTANLTSLNYSLARVQTQKTALLAQTMRQEDRIAKLESRERLAVLAAKLKMHDPTEYAIVTLPEPAVTSPPTRGVALLGAVGQWLGTAVGGSPR